MNITQILASDSVQNAITKAQHELAQAIGFDVTIEVYPKEEGQMDVDDIIRVFCAVWGVLPEKVIRKNRKADYVAMRQIIAMRLKMMKFSLKEIGRRLGTRDHTTIIYSLQSAKDRLGTEDELFMYYFNPVKHFFNMRNLKAIA